MRSTLTDLCELPLDAVITSAVATSMTQAVVEAKAIGDGRELAPHPALTLGPPAARQRARLLRRGPTDSSGARVREASG